GGPNALQEILLGPFLAAGGVRDSAVSHACADREINFARAILGPQNAVHSAEKNPTTIRWCRATNTTRPGRRRNGASRIYRRSVQSFFNGSFFSVMTGHCGAISAFNS